MDLQQYAGDNVLLLNDEYLLLQDFYMKGDDVQKLSVIQALPQLLQTDANATLTRIVPKIQQELPKSSCEFHIATSRIFRLLIEKNLPLNLMTAVLDGSRSKDPVVSNAWTETLLAVIPILPVDQVKTEVMTLAVSKCQMNNPVYSRVASCKILGKVATHSQIQSIDVKTNILPLVQRLCQDTVQDVRAAMCSQLHFVAQGLGDNLVKSSLLPNLVELAIDDNMYVRSSAVTAVVLIIPYLNKQTKLETIVPLIKQLCQRSMSDGDATFPTIAREYGKLLDGLCADLDSTDSTWFLQFFRTLSKKGAPTARDNCDPTQAVICREQCAYNLPALTFFTISQPPAQLEVWHSIFSDLANDSCYLVRKTVAGCIHEVARILGPQCRIIKQELVRLLRDDAEEVLELLVPHMGPILDMFCVNGVLSREQTSQSTLEIARAVLKCKLELEKGFNWRVKTLFLSQLEHLPNCMPSEFIHQHFTPVILKCLFESRAKPVKSQASRTLLMLLRYNLKEIQRKWIRDNLITGLCYSKSCYTRHIYIKMCAHATDIFSNNYFKKFFFEPLLSLTEDPISNVRFCVVGLVPVLYKMLVMPDDKKLQMLTDNAFSKMESLERDKDVKAILKLKLKEMRMGVCKQDGLMEEKRRQDEENKIAEGKYVAMAPQRYVAAQKNSSSHLSRTETVTKTVSAARSTSAPPPARTSVTNRASPAVGARDMSFLEQHFYIDAGISLPRKVDLAKAVGVSSLTQHKELRSFDNNDNVVDNDNAVATVSAENVDMATMSKIDLEKLQISTTNITDDVKVNLRKITNGQGAARRSATYQQANKRYSSVLSMTCLDEQKSEKKKFLNRRSLNIAAGDLSRIPVCLKKSKSNADVKRDGKNEASVSLRDIGVKQNRDDVTPVLKSADSSDASPEKSCVTTGNKSKVPIKSSIKENAPKTSGLPVLKRRTQSEVRR